MYYCITVGARRDGGWRRHSLHPSNGEMDIEVGVTCASVTSMGLRGTRTTALGKLQLPAARGVVVRSVLQIHNTASTLPNDLRVWCSPRMRLSCAWRRPSYSHFWNGAGIQLPCTCASWTRRETCPFSQYGRHGKLDTEARVATETWCGRVAPMGCTG